MAPPPSCPSARVLASRGLAALMEIVRTVAVAWKIFATRRSLLDTPLMAAMPNMPRPERFCVQASYQT
jgi:hypothetical protein